VDQDDDMDEGAEDEMSEGEEASGSEGEGQENNSCVVVYCQTRDHSFETYCQLQLVEQILCEKMFDQLRNKEQYGYSVSCQQRDTRGVLGMTFTIQSAEHSPRKCEQRIYQFIRDFDLDD
jgi:nardilysin